MANPVTYFEIAGKDGEKLNDFYSSVFDWKTEQNPFGGAYMVAPQSDEGIPGHLFPVTDDMDFTNHVTVYVEVNDLQASLDKAESLGGKTLIPPQDIPGNMGSFAWFIDPSGNCIGLYRQPDSKE